MRTCSFIATLSALISICSCANLKITPEFHGAYSESGTDKAALRQCFRNLDRYFPVRSSAELRVKVLQWNNLAGDYRMIAFAHRWTRSFEYRGKMYPTGLARAMGLKRKSFRYPEVVLYLASKFNWYYGLDGRPGRDQYDLITYCMREMLSVLIHGYPLIVMSKRYYNAHVHEYKPHRYLDFVAFRTTDNRDCALSSIMKDKRKLARAVQAGNLWFRSSKRRIVQLYAPPYYKRHVSIDYIDPNSNESGSDLLKPLLERGKAYHSVSTVVASMIKAMMDTNEKGAPICPSSVSPTPYRSIPERKGTVFGPCNIC